MPYMAQQWVSDQVRDAYRNRSNDARMAQAETAKVRAWLASLELGPAVAAAIDEPLAALEHGLRGAAERAREQA